VVARDVRLKRTLATTSGGASANWKVREAMSDGKVWSHFFGSRRVPIDQPRSPVHMETIERAW